MVLLIEELYNHISFADWFAAIIYEVILILSSWNDVIFYYT